MNPLEKFKKWISSVGENAKQQSLSAQFFFMYTQDVCLWFIGVSFFFVLFSFLMLITSYQVREVVVDYSGKKCMSMDEVDGWRGKNCEYLVSEGVARACHCKVDFEIKDGLKGDVYLYYQLTNFPQSHRRFQRSYDSKQLAGKSKEGSSSCEPFYKDPVSHVAYAPCGAAANAIFNDTFKLSTNSTSIPFLYTHLSWPSDKHKFRNPPDWNNTLKPPYWSVPVWELKAGGQGKGGYEDESFKVWMNPAMSSNFIKLYARIRTEVDPSFGKGLPPGRYSLLIRYAFPVSSFKGSKSVLITTLSWMGRKNVFMGVGYLVVGLSSLFLFVFLKQLNNKMKPLIMFHLHTINARTPYDLKSSRPS